LSELGFVPMTNIVRIKPYRGPKKPARKPVPDDKPADETSPRLHTLVGADRRSHRRRKPISLPKLNLLEPS